MRVSKNFLFLSVLLLSGTTAQCMFTEEEKLFNPDKLIPVHVSTILSENNQKIAGAVGHSRDGTTFIDPKGTNIRQRITFHTCLNGMVPKENHGTMLGGMGIGILSNLHKDKDACAYLDSLSAFKGEIYGGVPDDFIIIDGHTYGESSTIIVPEHRLKEFNEKNRNYKGKLLTYDPDIISLKEKVEEIIKQIPGASSFAEINDKKNRSSFDNFCKRHHYSRKDHNDTSFMFFEDLIKPFHQTISFLNRKCNTTPLLPADQIEPLSIVIENLLNHIQKKLAPKLSQQKNKAIEDWILETKSWLSLFERDAQLRLGESKSLFLNHLENDEIINIIRHKDDKARLNAIAQGLPSLEAIDNLEFSYSLPASIYLGSEKSQNLFPKSVLEKLHLLPLNHVRQLHDQLTKKGYISHANEMLLLYFMQHFESGNQNNKVKIFQKGGDLVSGLLSHLNPTAELRVRLEECLWTALTNDQSFKNENIISLLNNPRAKAFRQKIWGDSSTLDFLTLLKNSPKTNILFDDVETGESIKRLHGLQKRFIQIVREWLLKKAWLNEMIIPGCSSIISAVSQPETIWEELQNPQSSLFNFGYATEIVKKLSCYIVGLSQDMSEPKNPLCSLIEQGCFKSWGDLVGSLCDLTELNEDDLKDILQQQFSIFSLPQLDAKIENYVLQVREEKARFHGNKQRYEEVAHNIETAGDDVQVGCWGLHWYIETLLPNCINGFTQEIGNNKVIILPNLERAELLYNKLKELATPEEKRRIDELMEAVRK